MARLLAVLLIVVFALMTSNARLMNKREHIPKQFELLERTDSNQLHEFRLALKQRNLDTLEATLLDVSDPDSPNYGKWWTREQILDLIAPSLDEINPVVSWIKSHNGVEEIDVSGRDLIKVKAPISIIEQMFRTEMYNYRSLETGKIVSRVYGSVHVPDHLDVIDMVTGLTELVPKLSTRTKSVQKRKVEQNTDPKSSIGSHNIKPKNVGRADPLGIIYPGHLRDMYKVPKYYPVNRGISFAVIEFLNDRSYSPDDLSTFNGQMNENALVTNIIGPFKSNQPNAESTLDVQYGAAMASNTTFWFWTESGWMYEFATNLFGQSYFPNVASMSWGYPEDWQCQITACQQYNDYINRVNVEFMKIGLKGITLLAASGDRGAPGDEDPGCAGTISNLYPASSPWVVSVGATMLVSSPSSVQRRQSDQPPVCQQYPCSTITTEGVCTFPTAGITTGSGFSIVSSMPGWQKDYVNAYLKIATNLPYGQFNASNRAYPDVAVNGHNYGIFLNGQFTTVGGTSASAPVFGAMLSLLNSYLVNHGKNSIGFANPLLYKMYAADQTTFTDITTGNNYCTNECCGNVGFVATKGWDAVTGLGTPMFPRMQEYLRKNVVEKKN